MTISGNPPPDEVGSTVVGIPSQRVDAPAVDGPAFDATAADGLVERNYAAVYRYAYRLSGCAATAEDITQEVFVKAIVHLHQLRRAEAERGWLMSIARREFMRWLRESRGPAQGRAVPLDTNEVLTDERQPQRLDDEDWIQTALSLLSQEARVALLMYYFEELSYAEIAQQLQVPIGTVMSRLSRGRDHLRRALERASEASPAAASPAEGNTPPAAHLAPVLQQNILEESVPSAQEARHG